MAKHYTYTPKELRQSNASEFADGDIITVGKYDIFIRYSKEGKVIYNKPHLLSYVEKNGSKIDCTPGASRPYYIDDFLNR